MLMHKLSLLPPPLSLTHTMQKKHRMQTLLRIIPFTHNISLLLSLSSSKPSLQSR